MAARFEAQRRIVMGAPMIGVTGIVQREGEVIHVIGERLEDQTSLLTRSDRWSSPTAPVPATARRTAAMTRARSRRSRRDLFHPPFRHGPQARPDTDAPRPRVPDSIGSGADTPRIKVRSRDFH